MTDWLIQRMLSQRRWNAQRRNGARSIALFEIFVLKRNALKKNGARWDINLLPSSPDVVSFRTLKQFSSPSTRCRCRVRQCQRDYGNAGLSLSARRRVYADGNHRNQAGIEYTVMRLLPTPTDSVGVGRMFESVCLFVCLFVQSWYKEWL